MLVVSTKALTILVTITLCEISLGFNMGVLLDEELTGVGQKRSLRWP
jgi:hypothetical protein